MAVWKSALTSCDHEVARLNVTCGCCVPMPTQRAVPPGSVNEYQ